MEMNHDLSQSGNSPVIFITRDSLEVSAHGFVLFFSSVIIVVLGFFSILLMDCTLTRGSRQFERDQKSECHTEPSRYEIST